MVKKWCEDPDEDGTDKASIVTGVPCHLCGDLRIRQADFHHRFPLCKKCKKKRKIKRKCPQCKIPFLTWDITRRYCSCKCKSVYITSNTRESIADDQLYSTTLDQKKEEPPW